MSQERVGDGGVPANQRIDRASRRRSRQRTTTARRGLALVEQHRDGYLPAVAQLAEAHVIRHHGVVEKHLVELDVACDVAQRTDCNPGLVHRNEEHRNPFVLRHIRVGPGQQNSVRCFVGEAGPHLLPADPPLVGVAAADCAGAQAGEVGSGARLREQLAPHVLAAHDP